MKMMGPTILDTLATSNGASAENRKDLDECYYIIGEQGESFQDQCRYLNSVPILGDWKQKRVEHMTSKNVIFIKFSKISKISKIDQEASEVVGKCE